MQDDVDEPPEDEPLDVHGEANEGFDNADDEEASLRLAIHRLREDMAEPEPAEAAEAPEASLAHSTNKSLHSGR